MDQEIISLSERRQLATEINMLKQLTAQNIIEIGKRLIRAKEGMDHGEFGQWLYKKVDFSERTANNFMRVAREFPNPQAIAILGQTKIFALLEVPQEERESFVEANNVENMTTRELRQAIKEKKESEEKANDLQIELEQLKSKTLEVVTIEKVVEKVPDDYYKLSKDVISLKHLVEDKGVEIGKLLTEKGILERKAKLNDKEAKEYAEFKNQIEQLTKQKDNLSRQIKAATELSGLVVRVENLLKTELAPIKYSRAISEACNDEIVTENLVDILGRVQDWLNEMYQYIPMKQYKENIIKMEVESNE